MSDSANGQTWLDGENRTGERSRAAWLLLALLLLWSLSLRIWFATPSLNSGRYWDERFSIRNVSLLLRGGGLRPENGFHPSLSYLPQAGVLAASELLHKKTGIEVFAIREGRTPSPTAYMLCRSVQAVFGVLSLYFTFLIGRRAGGEGVGLLGALLLAVMPWHVRQSVIFKPDILLLLTTLIGFYLSMKAVDRPSLRSYLVAGVAIGCALSTKFNAGPVAIPLTIGTLFGLRHNRRALIWLVCAGLVALGVFLLLNPYVLMEPDVYRRTFGTTTLRDYARKGATRGGGSRLYLLGHVVLSLLGGNFHGPIIGSLGLIGLAAVGFWSVKQLRRSRSAVYWLMGLGYVVGYVTLYALVTTNPSAHNWLTLTPFIAIAAAWLLMELWSLLGRSLPPLRRPAVAVLLVAVLIPLLTRPTHSYVYERVVPSSKRLAGFWIARELPFIRGAMVCSEIAMGSRHLKRGRSTAAVLFDQRFESHGHDALDLCDAVVFPSARLEDPETQDFYEERVRRVGEGQHRRVESRLFRAHGPSLVALVHPLAQVGESERGQWVQTPEDPTLYRAELPSEPGPARLVSLEYWLPRGDGWNAESQLLLGEQRLDSLPHGMRRLFSTLHLTPRFRWSGEALLRIECPGETPETISFTLRTWERAATAP